MTLEQVFPGLSSSPGGAIIAVSDSVFDFGGPARAATTEVARNWTNQWIAQIKAIEPSFRYDSFGFPKTLQGQITQLNDLRWTRATLLFRVKGVPGPLQVEALRFLQDRTDRAYADGMKLLRAGKLPPRPTPEMALGNYIDRRVRTELRDHYRSYGFDTAGSGPIRVNRREYDTLNEQSFTIPDSRILRIGFDVSLTRKDLRTPQVRGFFSSQYQPTHVIIVRPRQLGAGHTYVISRPESR